MDVQNSEVEATLAPVIYGPEISCGGSCLKNYSSSFEVFYNAK
jgi:hypothetical protein